MKYPHWKYVRYLLSRGMTSYEIMADCTARALLPPSEDYLRQISDDLGAFPASWRSTVDKGNVSLRRWLRDKGVMPLWRQDAPARKALDFLLLSDARTDFESLMIIHADVEKCRAELLLKYPERMVPGTKALDLYVEFFWDMGSLTHTEIFEFCQANQEREELLPALRGDLVTTYAMLGLRQRVEEEELYDNIIALANQMVLRVRRAPHQYNGQAMAGVSTLARQAMDAAVLRKGLHDLGVDDDIREAAIKFKARYTNPLVIPSIDDLSSEEEDERDFIDADYEDATAEGNVRRFPTSR